MHKQRDPRASFTALGLVLHLYSALCISLLFAIPFVAAIIAFINKH